MSEIGSVAPIRFFGASLDARDQREAVELKKSYLRAKMLGELPEPDWRDPYALFRSLVGDQMRAAGHQLVGRFAIESWLTPKPEITDGEWVDERSYRQFVENNGFRSFATWIREFVQTHILPFTPGMIGVDHSLTGGVIRALSDHLGAERLGLVIFDAHTDAIPLSIRTGLARYASENGFPSPGNLVEPCSSDPYTAGSFLYDLIEEGAILPEHLVLIGPGDHADLWRKSEDPRVREYVRHYDTLLAKGIQIVSRGDLKTSGLPVVRAVLNDLNCSSLYVSLDVDVCAQCGVLGARYIEQPGIEISFVLEALSEIVRWLGSTQRPLAGFDIMEIDIYRVGAELEERARDQTEAFVRDCVLLLAGHVTRREGNRPVQAGEAIQGFDREVKQGRVQNGRAH